MIWLTWRQFRAQAAVVFGALAVVAIILAVTGPNLVHLYNACKAAHSCGQGSFTSTDHSLQIGVQVLLLVAPALIGIFWGAPLVARELETGTYRLGWTQSVTRRHWLAMKVGLVGLSAVALGGLLSLLVTWWLSPIDAWNTNRFDSLVFGLRGITPIGYAAFAFALGVTAGVLMRRTLPAMATTIVAYVVVRLGEASWVRPHLLPPAHTDVPMQASNVGIGVGPGGGPAVVTTNVSIPNAWVYSSSMADKAGHPPTSHFLDTACPDIVSGLNHLGIQHQAGHGTIAVGPATQGAFQACIAKVAANFHEVVTYQPASRYWAFQGLETGLFVVLALMLTGVSFWWVRHRLS
jgi:hypothetical protein